MQTSFSKSISRRVFEPPPQRGFARHLLCDIGEIHEQQEVSDGNRTKNALYAALARWRWQLPPPVYRHEQLPRPLHLISSSPPRLRYHAEERLLDATLDWSCDTFCNLPSTAQAGDMIVYKSLAMLKIIEPCATSAQLFLVGTAVPRDVYILIGVKMFSSGVFSVAAYRRFLQASGEQSDQLKLPATSNKNIAALLIPRSTRPLLTPTNPLNQCLTLFASAKQIPELLTDSPMPEDKHTHVWQRRNEHDIIDMAAELLD